MLRNMFIGNPPGNYDRILDFSTARHRHLFFVPSLEIARGHRRPEPHASRGSRSDGGASNVSSRTDNDDGSLGIGGLKGAST